MVPAQTPPRAVAAPRARGPWFFAGLWIIFWLLLALTGLGGFKNLESAERRYAVPASQLVGVTHLRIDGDPGEARGYAPQTRVVVGSGGDDLVLTLQSRHEGRRARAHRAAQAGTPARPEPPVAAMREGDTLVLRWLPPVRAPGAAPSAADADDDDTWIREITVPAQFWHLRLSHALVDALEPVERLQVAGRSVEVRGQVSQLDLQSTVCARCAPAAGGAQDPDCDARDPRARGASLEVVAGGMRSVRIAAEVGQVALKSTQRLQQLDLRLGDGAALSVDRTGVLRLARVAPAEPEAGCNAPGAAPAAAPSTPLELVRRPAATPAPGR